jgi:hypothetical protein
MQTAPSRVTGAVQHPQGPESVQRHGEGHWAARSGGGLKGAAFQVLLEGGRVHAAALQLGPLRRRHPLVDGDRIPLQRLNSPHHDSGCVQVGVGGGVDQLPGRPGPRGWPGR